MLNPKNIIKTEENSELPDETYPEGPEDQPEEGYVAEYLKTKAKIYPTNKNINKTMDDLLKKYEETEIKKRSGEVARRKNKMLFFVDPCGVVSWNDVVDKIGKRANQREGIELILNWSCEAFTRNKTKSTFPKTLSEIYGVTMREAKVIQSACPNNEIEEYFKIYQAQLRKYWKYVEKIVIKKYTTIKPKAPRQPSYYLVFCTNNKEGHSIATNKFEKINEKLQRGDYQDIGKLLKSMLKNQST